MTNRIDNPIIKAKEIYADYLKGNKDGKIDANEQEAIELFHQQVVEAYGKGQIDAEAFNQAMGLYKENTNPESATTPAITFKAEDIPETPATSKKADKKDNERAQDAVLEKFAFLLNNEENRKLLLNEFKVKGADAGLEEADVTQANILSVLKEEFKAFESDSRYTKIFGDIEKILNALPKDKVYKNYKEAEKAIKDVKSNLKSQGLDNNFCKDILDYVEAVLKFDIRQKAYSDIKTRFDKLKAEGKGNSESLKQIKKELTDEGLVLSGEWLDDDKHRNAYVAAFRDFDRDVTNKLKTGKVLDYVDAQTDSTRTRDVKRGAKKAAKASEDWDRNMRQAFKSMHGDEVTGKDKIVKDASANIANRNDVEQHKELTKDEIIDGLGKHKTLFENLVNAGLVVDTDNDGKYDITALQNLLIQYTGDDLQLTKPLKGNENISEKKQAAAELEYKLSTKVTEKDVVKLVKLCGLENGKVKLTYDPAKGALGAGLGAIAHGATAAAATWHNPNQGVKINPEDLPDIVLEQSLEDLLGEEAHLYLQQGGYDITVDITGKLKTIISGLLSDDKVVGRVVPKLIGLTGMKSAILGAVIGALAGIETTGYDIPVIPKDMEAQTFDEYASKLQDRYPEFASMFILIASTFIKDGNWDKQAYEDLLNSCSGKGSALNKRELMGRLQRMKNEVEDETTTTTTTTTPQNDVANVEKEGTQIEKPEYEDNYVTYSVEYGDSWAKIVEEFYPDLITKYEGRLYDVWKNGQRVKKGAIGALKEALAAGDKELLKQLREQGDIPKTLNLPKVIEGTNINPDAGKVKKVKIDIGGSTTLKEAGEKGKRQSGVTYLPGPDLYIAYDVADTSNKCQGSTEAEALAELEKKTGKTYEVINRNY